MAYRDLGTYDIASIEHDLFVRVSTCARDLQRTIKHEGCQTSKGDEIWTSFIIISLIGARFSKEGYFIVFEF